MPDNSNSIKAADFYHVVNMDYRELTGIAHARVHPQPIVSRGSDEGSGDARETGYTPAVRSFLKT